MFAANKLKLLYENSELTLENISQQTGINFSTLYRLINGLTMRPRPETINTLATYFGVEPNDLYIFEHSNDLPTSSNYIQFKNIKQTLEYLLIYTGIINTTRLSELTHISKSNLDRILNKDIKPQHRTLSQLSKFFKLSIKQISGLEPFYISDINIINTTVKIPLIDYADIIKWFNNNNYIYEKYTNIFITINDINSLIAISIKKTEYKNAISKNSIIILQKFPILKKHIILLAIFKNIIDIYEYINVDESCYTLKSLNNNTINNFPKINTIIIGEIIKEISL